MDFTTSISSGHTDKRLYLRTTPAAVLITVSCFVACACGVVILLPNAVQPIVSVFFLSAGFAVVLSEWMRWNRQLGSELRAAIFKQGKILSDTERVAVYSQVRTWLRLNGLAPGQMEWARGATMSWILGDIYRAVDRRAKQQEHLDTIDADYPCGVTVEYSRETILTLQRRLDEREGSPTYTESHYAIGRPDNLGQLFITVLLFFLGMATAVGL
jgi:hypothetical protein